MERRKPEGHREALKEFADYMRKEIQQGYRLGVHRRCGWLTSFGDSREADICFRRMVHPRDET
jgi:hypothetical protein